MVTWGDWNKSIEDLQSKYNGPFFTQASAEKVRDIAREGIDIFVTIEYSNSQGQFLSTSVIGRQTAARGNLLSKASATGPKSGDLFINDSESGETAKVSLDRMPQVLQDAMDAAVAVSLRDLDGRYWEPLKAPDTGLRARKSAGAKGQETAAAGT
jgi:hypothetical protein